MCVCVCVFAERGQSGHQGLLGRHRFKSLSLLWHWKRRQEPAENTEWATHQSKTTTKIRHEIWVSIYFRYALEVSCVLPSFLLLMCRQPRIFPLQTFRDYSSPCPADGAASHLLSQTQRQKRHPQVLTRALSRSVVKGFLKVALHTVRLESKWQLTHLQR